MLGLGWFALDQETEPRDAAPDPDLVAVGEHRRLLQELRRRHGKVKATRKYVYNMFPYGYGQQACKIAGMRVPLKILLDL